MNPTIAPNIDRGRCDQPVVDIRNPTDVARFRPRLLAALTFLLTEDGVPCIYYGTEQDFTGGNDPSNRERLWDTGFDTTEVLKETQEKFLPFRREWAPGTHFELGFGHLDGYSAIYYTYQWSTVIAKDLLTQFRAGGMLDGKVATQYRKKVLEPGGSREAGALVQEFLGRPYSFDAFQQWLDGK
jgi:glycosidase